MTKQNNKHIILLVSCLSVIICCKKENILTAQENSLILAQEFLIKIEGLNQSYLKKMHKRGCVHNCWDFTTTEKLFEYENELNKLGYSLVWDFKDNKYFIQLRID